MNIIENKTQYSPEQLFAIAKRDNNTKRAHLLVNYLQAKHAPASPDAALNLFARLGRILTKNYSGKKVLIVGFAETATAIGAAVAREFGEDAYYLHTTREHILGVARVVDFNEEHSHATEQTLFCADWERQCAQADVILFVEDEITTGKTILNFIAALRENKLASSQVQFAAASIINGMNRESERCYKMQDIAYHYLVKIACEDFAPFIEDVAQTKADAAPRNTAAPKIQPLIALGRCDPRVGVRVGAYENSIASLFDEIVKTGGADFSAAGSALILGTEECMYPAILIAQRISSLAPKCNIRVHATTRSPILPHRRTNYPIRSRRRLRSMYDAKRITYIYNLKAYDKVIVVTDAPGDITPGAEDLRDALLEAGCRDILFVKWVNELRGSYKKEDVTLLLKDISGMVEPRPTAEREALIQSGAHYSEMLPIEYKPTERYLELYRGALKDYGKITAAAVAEVSEKLFSRKGGAVVLVSLARAGTPIGILIKRYLARKFGIDAPHYSISIIRGKGVDKNAMRYILGRHAPETLQFVDGWTGKGAIFTELKKELKAFPAVSPHLAVLADPAHITDLCGTHEDFLIPSSCLNAAVSGLISRTFLREDIIGPDDFHGAAFYEHLAHEDLSYEFIHAIEKNLYEENISKQFVFPAQSHAVSGLDEVNQIAREFKIPNTQLIKPGIGETTRVLLRRVPWKILVKDKRDTPFLAHIFQLAREKNVEVLEYPLRCYRACGIIQKAAADA